MTTAKTTKPISFGSGRQATELPRAVATERRDSQQPTATTHSEPVAATEMQVTAEWPAPWRFTVVYPERESSDLEILDADGYRVMLRSGNPKNHRLLPLIVDAVNSIDSLREENRVLREATENLLSVAQKLPQPATVDGLTLADALAAVRAALRLGEGRE